MSSASSSSSVDEGKQSQHTTTTLEIQKHELVNRLVGMGRKIAPIRHFYYTVEDGRMKIDDGGLSLHMKRKALEDALVHLRQGTHWDGMTQFDDYGRRIEKMAKVFEEALAVVMEAEAAQSDEKKKENVGRDVTGRGWNNPSPPTVLPTLEKSSKDEDHSNGRAHDRKVTVVEDGELPSTSKTQTEDVSKVKKETSGGVKRQGDDADDAEHEAKRAKSERVSIWYRKSKSGHYVCLKQRHNFLSFHMRQTPTVVRQLAKYWIVTRQDEVEMMDVLADLRATLLETSTKDYQAMAKQYNEEKNKKAKLTDAIKELQLLQATTPPCKCCDSEKDSVDSNDDEQDFENQQLII